MRDRLKDSTTGDSLGEFATGGGDFASATADTDSTTGDKLRGLGGNRGESATTTGDRTSAINIDPAIGRAAAATYEKKFGSLSRNIMYLKPYHQIAFPRLPKGFMTMHNH